MILFQIVKIFLQKRLLREILELPQNSWKYILILCVIILIYIEYSAIPKFEVFSEKENPTVYRSFLVSWSTVQTSVNIEYRISSPRRRNVQSTISECHTEIDLKFYKLLSGQTDCIDENVR